MASENTASKSNVKTSSDLWSTTLYTASVLILILTTLFTFLRTQSSQVQVPVRLAAGNEFVQGSWQSSYLYLLIVISFVATSYVYSHRLSKLDPIYKNGVLVATICVQLLALAVLYRVSGLTSLI